MNWAAVNNGLEIDVTLYHDQINTPSANTTFTFYSKESMQYGWNVLPIASGWDMVVNRTEKGHRATLESQQWQNGGGGAWDPTQGINGIVVQTTITGSETAWDGDLYGLVWGGMTYGTRHDAVVLPTFDDGRPAFMTVTHPVSSPADPTRDGKTVFEYFKENDIVGTLGIIGTTHGGVGNTMTDEQVQECIDEGWAVVTHGSTAWGDDSEWNNLTTNMIEWTVAENGEDGVRECQDTIDAIWAGPQVRTDIGVYPLNNYRNSGFTNDNWSYEMRNKLQQSDIGMKMCRTSWPVNSYFPAIESPTGGYWNEMMSLGGGPMEAVESSSLWGYAARYTDRGLFSQKLMGGVSAPYFHDIVTKTTVPDTATPSGQVPLAQPGETNPAFYIEDMFDVVDKWVEMRDAGELQVMTMPTFYESVKHLPAVANRYPNDPVGTPANARNKVVWDQTSFQDYATANPYPSSGLHQVIAALYVIGADEYSLESGPLPADVIFATSNGSMYVWDGSSSPSGSEWPITVRGTNTFTGDYTDVNITLYVE